MSKWKSIADIRREYGQLALDEAHIQPNPIAQFELWFSEVLEREKSDPTAMVLATVDDKGHPDTRVVLLKGLIEGSFIFYTNYHSLKAQQIAAVPYVALNFYWPQMARQVRVRGDIKKISPQQSDQYFSSRPKSSQFSAIASPQSQVLSSRDELEKRLNQLIETHQQQTLMRPDFWGGYEVIPFEFEFWQGRDNRLHDRIQYYLSNNQWAFRRLAP